MATLTRSQIDKPAQVGLSLKASIAELAGMELDAASNRSRDFLDWCMAIPIAKGGRLDFNRFPFQPELYRSFGNPALRDVRGMKGVQLGISELLARLTIFFADTHGYTSLYTFPAKQQLYDFSDTRIKPLIEGSDYLRSRILPGFVQNKGLKRFGLGHVYYRGSESRNDLISVDADVLALDEYDDLHPPNIPEAEGRLEGSLVGLIRRVGVPTDPEYGIAKLYEQSDQRRWHVTCGACGERQPIDFFKNVNQETATLVCRHCAGALDVSKGEWVAEFPDRPDVGYHVHRLIVPGANIARIIAASLKRDPLSVTKFWRNMLGLPYADKAGGLDRAAIAAALSAAVSQYGDEILMVDAYTGPNIVTMGVDVASARALNYRISEHIDPLWRPGHRKRALKIGTADSFDEIADLIDRFHVNYACVDHLPEMRLTLGLAERYPGRVYAVNYASNMKDVISLNTEDRTVAVQRVPAMDATIQIMRGQRNFLPADIPTDYVEHMISERRKIKKDEYGRTTVFYESIGPSDYFHAETYDVIAAEVAKIRMEVEQATEGEGEIVSMDEHLEYRRTGVADYEDTTYRPGPAGPYSPGPNEG